MSLFFVNILELQMSNHFRIVGQPMNALDFQFSIQESLLAHLKVSNIWKSKIKQT